jgi:hypothetical protein
MKGQIDRWFQGNAANEPAPTQQQAGTIRGNFQDVADGLDGYKIEYESDADTDGWGMCDFEYIYIRKYYFFGRNQTPATARDRFGTVIHELSHLLAWTGDAAYFRNPESLDNPNMDVVWLDTADSETEINVTTAALIGNADSYAGFLSQFYFGN